MADDVSQEANASDPSGSGSGSGPSGPSDPAGDPLGDELVARSRAASRTVLFLDYDGTLKPFAARPEDARPDAELLRLIDALAAAHETWVVTGRGKKDIDALLGAMPVGLGAEHGAWVRPPPSWNVKPTPGGDGAWSRLLDKSEGPARVLPHFEELVRAYPGSRIETKDTSYCWHYRLAAPRPDDLALAHIEANLRQAASEHGCHLLEAVLAFEVRPNGVQKGLVIDMVQRVRSLDDAFVLVAGDDVTDGDLFAAAPAHAMRVGVGDRIPVGRGPREATHHVDAPKTLRAALARLLPRAAVASTP
jgi:trehalose 6-phosphate synthase/phosphatase